MHVVSQRARVLRLRRTYQSLAISVIDVLPSPLGIGVGILFHRLFEGKSALAASRVTDTIRTREEILAKERQEARFRFIESAEGTKERIFAGGLAYRICRIVCPELLGQSCRNRSNLL